MARTPQTAEQKEAAKNETKNEKFVRIAPGRVDKVLVSMRALAQMFSATYEATDEQKAKVGGAVQDEFNALVDAIQGKAKAKSSGFTL